MQDIIWKQCTKIFRYTAPCVLLSTNISLDIIFFCLFLAILSRRVTVLLTAKRMEISAIIEIPITLVIVVDSSLQGVQVYLLFFPYRSFQTCPYKSHSTHLGPIFPIVQSSSVIPPGQFVLRSTHSTTYGPIF